MKKEKVNYSVTLNPYAIALKPHFIKNGNIKLGGTMWTWSTLPGNAIFNTEIGDVKGTCGNHCKGCFNEEAPSLSPCYVFKALNRYPSVKKCYARNTAAMRFSPETVTSLLLKQIRNARKKPSIIRINQSGEMESINDLYMYIALANFNPDITFYLYTKNFDLILKNADIIPENLKVNISVWHENGIQEYKRIKAINKNVKAFVYDDKTFNYAAHGLKIETYCKAYDEKGKMNHNITCDKCRKCFNDHTNVIGCFDH